MPNNINRPTPPGQTTTTQKIRSLRRLSGLTLAVLGFSSSLASADTTPITVQDPSFETAGTWGPAGTWASINTVWNASFFPYSRTNDTNRFSSVPDGTWYANFTDPGNTVTQDLLTPVNAGDTLTVTFYAGREKSNVGGIITATFMVGSTPYSQDFDTTGLEQNTWQSYTLTKTIGNSDNLSLKFNRVSGRPWLDNISDVTVTPGLPPSGEPISTDATLTADEDTPAALTTDNFGYSDPGGVAFAAVQITSLPTHGTLQLEAADITLGAEIPVADIPKLTYQSALNGNGTVYATIGIKVKNANGKWSLADTVMTVNVMPVNDPPTSTGGLVSMKANAVKTFAPANFQFSDIDAGDTLGAIKVTSLPANGTLNLGGAPVSESQEVPVADIGTLTYTPTTDYGGDDTFNFQVRDGTDFSSDATMTITVIANVAPIATDASVVLRADTVKTFAATDFPFSDGDASDTLSAIKVTSLPTYGTLSLDVGTEIPVADIGTLTYTPSAGYIGEDSFNFQVSDGMDFSTDSIMAITVTADILVRNAGFEAPTPHNPNNGTNADWTAGGWAFIGAPWTTSNSLYGRLSQGPVASPQLGNWIVNLNDAGAWVKQDLGTAVNAGDILSVTFNVMSDTAPGEIAAAFLVGDGPTEYSQTFNNPQNNGTWVPYTLIKTIEVSGNLSLRCSNVSGRVWIDNISNVSVTTGTGGGSYAEWAAANGAGSQTMAEDHDHDGVSNGIEYFLGGNGNTTGFTRLPGVVKALDGTRSVTWTKAASGYPGVYGTDYVVQTSTTLAADSWTNEAASGGGVTFSGNDVIYTFSSSSPAKQFCRLVVTGTP